MRNLLRLAFTAVTSSASATVLLIGFLGPAAAGFLDNRAAWDELSPPLKHGYVMGVWDEMMILSVEATGLNSYRTDLNTCVQELELHAGHFIEIIELQYQDVANWQFGPVLVLSKGLREACLDRINAYRAERGEPPLE